MALLFDEDYSKLEVKGISYKEDEQQRFFIFTDFELPAKQFTVDTCNILVAIPPNYNQGGNDMFWTYPFLQRSDGKQIPAVHGPGGGDNRVWDGKEYCRWSRHWPEGHSGAWRPGKDDIISIYRRLEWALRHPDTQ